MADIDLEKKFPEMRPVRNLPSLANFYGCGFGFHGSRDHDAETESFVRTHCLCLFFVPIFALGAYRVLPTSSGWYVIGRERVSGLAKIFNFTVVAGAITAGSVYGWHTYTHTPNYIATQKLEQADKLAAAGQFAEAARLYGEVAAGDTDHARTAVQDLDEMLYGALDKADLDAIMQVLKITMDLNERDVLSSDMAKLVKRVDQLVRGHENSDPQGVLNAINVVVPPGAELSKFGIHEEKDAEFIAGFLLLQERALQQIVADSPDDVDAISQLALIYETQGQFEKCESMLSPHAKKLGDSEGARVLGQILARKGEFEQSEELLLPYCEERLEKLHAAERKLNQLFETTQTRLIEELRSGKGPKDLQRKIENARNDQTRMALVNEYIGAELDKNIEIKRTQIQLTDAARVVPVALDLGIVLLRRGQDLADPAARKSSLEKAEKTFLSIRGVAGESDQYRLFLGQVYYWLGKQDEGREQFEQLLKTKGDDFETLLVLSTVLREVGEVPQARTHAEKAYNSTSESQQRSLAAVARAVMSIDLDDKIKWLRRTDQKDIQSEARLNDALAEQAIRDGDDETAADYLRKSISLGAKLPKASASLNNTALSHFRLYNVTGDGTSLSKGLEMMDEAVAMSPSDSILLGNAASSITSAAIRDLSNEEIDHAALKMDGSLDDFAYLYDDGQARSKFEERLKAHKGIQRAVSYYERVVTLAPKNRQGYEALVAVYGFTDDAELLKGIFRRIEEGDPDLSDVNAQTLKYLNGELDEEINKAQESRITQLRETLEKLSAGDSPVTFAVAATALARLLMHQLLLQPELESDGDEYVDLAEQAHAAAPSVGTRHTLVAALMSRAGRTLAGQEDSYRQLKDKYSRSLSPPYLISVAANREGTLRDAVRANPDVTKALDLMVEDIRTNPQGRDVWDWAMLRFAKPELASEIAEYVRSSEADRLQHLINLRLNPLSGAYAYNVFWLKLIENDEAAGLEALRQCSEAGVPLPWKEETANTMN